MANKILCCASGNVSIIKKKVSALPSSSRSIVFLYCYFCYESFGLRWVKYSDQNRNPTIIMQTSPLSYQLLHKVKSRSRNKLAVNLLSERCCGSCGLFF